MQSQELGLPAAWRQATGLGSICPQANQHKGAWARAISMHLGPRGGYVNTNSIYVPLHSNTKIDCILNNHAKVTYSVTVCTESLIPMEFL